MLVLGIQGEPRPGNASGALAASRTTGWYHDAAAVLLRDGYIVAAIEEERLNRQKHSGRFPTAAIRFCLKEGGIDLDEVDFIAFGERGGDGPYLDPTISPAQIASVLDTELGCGTGIAARVVLVEHHLAHAVSAYAASGFAEALVVTADGFGDGVAGYISGVRDGVITILDRIDVASSLGRFYGSSLSFFGFEAFSEYKVMGLAPYGDPTSFRTEISRMYELLPGGRFLMTAKSRAEKLEAFDRLGPPRRPDARLAQLHCDVAAAIQEALETILRHVLQHFRARRGIGCCASRGVQLRIASLRGSFWPKVCSTTYSFSPPPPTLVMRSVQPITSPSPSPGDHLLCRLCLMCFSAVTFQPQTRWRARSPRRPI